MSSLLRRLAIRIMKARRAAGGADPRDPKTGRWPAGRAAEAQPAKRRKGQAPKRARGSRRGKSNAAFIAARESAK